MKKKKKEMGSNEKDGEGTVSAMQGKDKSPCKVLK